MLGGELLILVGKFLNLGGVCLRSGHVKNLLLDGGHLVLHATKFITHELVGICGCLQLTFETVKPLKLSELSGHGLLKILCVGYNIAEETSNLLLNQGHVARLLLHALLINEGEHVVLVLAKIGLCGLDCLVGV